ncbi:methyl-accepting chemotaxis protein [Massilia sp. H6]|uniref:methyl-accepting chemotaxis protein n=1 Tax=Massilia sp. H6 TaxID=2970464 RepID=UPI002167DA9B|nr:methyl-accepting chemotaxis protein [Massilia sp. H6]UVW28012.1 methyl-accepting chemotaxis protein [Massilia sp. H6]
MITTPLSIGARLAFGCGSFILLIIVLSALAIGRVGEIERALDHINNITSVKQRYAINLRASVRDRSIALRDVVLAPDAAHAVAPIGLIKTQDDLYARFASPMDALFHELPDTLAAEKDALAAIKEQERRTRPLIERVAALHAAGQVAQASALLTQQAAPAFVDWLASINGFIGLQEQIANEHAAAARRTASGFFSWMVLLCISAIVAGGLGAWALAQGLRRQFAQRAVPAPQPASPASAAAPRLAQAMATIDASSSKIVDIMGVADDLAFRTTLLALSAAVEAARAGERRHAFADVAIEVSVLAQRSAVAAQDIRELVALSVDRVEAGARLVDEAGERMDELVAAVRRVTDVIDGITPGVPGHTVEPCRQDAIGQMSEAAGLNAVLVRQAAAAAAALETQARCLAQVAGSSRPGVLAEQKLEQACQAVSA